MPEPISATVAFVTAAYSSAVAATATVLGAMGTVGALGMGGTYALAGAIVKGGIMMGLSAASAALLRPDVPSSGTTLDFKPDPKAPVRGAMGYTALGGNKVFQATWGYKKVAMSLGVALSLGPIDQVPRFEADGATVTFSGPQSEATGFYAADMWQRTTLGLPGDAALLPPTGLKYGNPGLTGWGTQHAAPQVSFSFWTMVLAKNPEDRDVFTNGVPDPRWIGRWMKLWDPRKDSTYPGGSGPQRRDDWRTWEWSENPYVHSLAWFRGHYKLNLDGTVDRRKRIAGVGAPDSAIDIPAFVEGMNIADANAWTISGEWSTSDGKFQTALAMLQAGGGEPISRGAQISVMVNAPRVATYTYTRDDLIGQAEIRPLTPRRERKNTIVPRYKSEANGWQYVPAGEVTSSVYRDEDRGEPRSLEIEYTHVRNAKQAGQLAAYDLANLREGLTATLPSKVHLMHVHPGDCITVDVPELALAGQKFVVRRATMNHQAASVTLELRSESDGKHAWALGQAAQPAPSPSLSAVDPKYVPPPAPDDWTVVPKPPGGGGVSQPIVIIELPIETTDIIAVIIKHGPSAVGPWTDGYEGSPRPDGRYEIAGLTPGQTYCFSLQYVAKNGAKSEPDIKCGIIAGDLTAGNVVPTAPTIVDLQGQITTAFGDIFDVSELVGQTRADLEAADAALGSAIGSLDTRADQLETATQTLEANKASVASLNAQIARINDVEAVNATQALALVDLENGKVALSEYNTLKGEVQAARDGAPSLLGQIQNLKSVDLDLQNNKASVASVNALTARTANTEADIIDIENALATEVLARAEAVNEVRAASRHRDNLLPNGGFEGGTSGITARIIVGGVATTLATSVIDGPNGRVLSVGPYGPGLYVIEWPEFSIYGNDDYTLTGDAAVFGIGADDQTYFDLQMAGPNGEDLGEAGDGGQSILVGPRDFSLANRDGYAFTTHTPSGAGRARARYVVNCAIGPTLIQLRQVKAERGALPATAYSADQAQRALSATVTEQSLAIIDLENQQALAAYELIANASGSDPAYLRLVSSTAGGYAALASSVVALQTTSGGQVKTALRAFNGNVHIGDKLYLGDDGLWVFDPVTKTESIRGTGFAKVRGRGFGANGDLTEWSGPNIAIGAMTKANGVRWEDVNGNAYFGGNLSAGVLTARDRTSSLSVSASVDTGRYNSHGGAISVTVSLSGGWGKSYYSPTNLAAATETGTVEVSLDRAVNGGAFTDGVAIMSRAYSWTRENQGFEPGLGFLISESGGYSGSLTYTDPHQVAQDRQYRARIITFSPITLAGPPTIQDLGVISVE